MTTTNTNTIVSYVKASDNTTIITEAKKLHYIHKPGVVCCESCYEQMLIARDAVLANQGTKSFDISQTRWVNTNTAMVFQGTSKTKHYKIVACACGWRKITRKNEQVTPTAPAETKNRYCPECAKNGVKSILPKDRALCYKCSPAEKCHGKDCNNTLPDGRKTFCFKCRPPKTKKEVVM